MTVMFCFLRLDHYIYCECTTQLPVVYCMHCNTKIVSDVYSMICMVLLCKSVEVIVLTETTMSRFIVFHFGCSFFCPPTPPPHPFVFFVFALEGAHIFHSSSFVKGFVVMCSSSQNVQVHELELGFQCNMLSQSFYFIPVIILMKMEIC